MLPADLLDYTLRSGRAFPRFAPPHKALPWAEGVLRVIAEHKGKTRGELEEALRALEGDSPDYTLVRGLAHLALAEATLEVQSPLEPEFLRSKVFALAAQGGHGEREALAVLREVGNQYALEAETVRASLYADLKENHVLTKLPDLSPAELLERHDLAQAQGLLYYATEMVLQAHRNTSAQYKRLFRYLKYYRLMFAVEGDLDSGYRIHVDGPTSVLGQTRRYGVQMAALLPSLLSISILGTQDFGCAKQHKSSGQRVEELWSGVVTAPREKKPLEALPYCFDAIEVWGVGRLEPEGQSHLLPTS